jgi:hypothetical protein
VPPGSYYLKVEAPGYAPYQGQPFDVRAGNGVHTNLELIPHKDWKDSLIWQNVLLTIFGVIILGDAYATWKRRRKRKE